MNYEEKYKNALEWARQVMNGETGFIRKEVENIFPELKGSKDERIRKELIDFVKSRLAGFPQCEKFIAWIEKQKEFVSADFDDVWETADCDELTAPLEKYSKDAIKEMCHAWYDKGIELERKSWLEKQGEQHSPIDINKMVDKFAHTEVNGYGIPSMIDVDAYRKGIEDTLKKQSEQKETLCDKCKKAQSSHSCQDITALGRCAVEHKQKLANEVGPKFKVGDWIVGDEGIFKITQYEDNYGYELTDTTGHVAHFISPDHVESKYHLWTIKDAKDGDVLATFVGAFIYNGNNGGGSCPGSYCGINTLGRFQTYVEDHWTTKKVFPATKEQRDTLFAKMKEAGYEWDSVTKELKRIAKFNVGDWITTTNEEGNATTKKIIEFWSDKIRLVDTDGVYALCPKHELNYYHLWTIQDAKFGDVLISSMYKQPFVYNGNYTSNSIGAYFGLNYKGELLITDSHDNNWSGLIGVQPATVEQCDMLFKKLHDSDYKWDSEKKELWHKYL